MPVKSQGQRQENLCRREEESERETNMAAGMKGEARKRAWIYCAIDALEDTHGILKEQFKQLMDYGEQMGFELTGSSSDIGAKPLWKRHGFQSFVHAVKRGEVNVLLIVSRNSLSRSDMQMAQFQITAERYGVDFYSPIEGKMNFNDDCQGGMCTV